MRESSFWGTGEGSMEKHNWGAQEVRLDKLSDNWHIDECLVVGFHKSNADLVTLKLKFVAFAHVFSVDSKKFGEVGC